ncbi:hypothetical protein [Streptomyces graminilatus]|uniref:hypothetical protein n=1 Tax=Streptomyces graminilatus TaxID=1464070 RepID=UPI0006E1A92C|nr:hypothetical protein [Streptomyces graminilatus]
MALFLAAVATVPMISQAAASESAQRKASFTAAEVKLLNSETPKTVTLDPATGALLAVEKGISGVEPSISKQNICQTGNACWYTTRVPYANFGFYGSAGTYSASMPYRGDYHTGSYRASACWTYTGPACSQTLPPNTYVTLGVTVTGTSFTIH